MVVGKLVLTLALSAVMVACADQTSDSVKPRVHRLSPRVRQIRASLAPTDFPITLTAYDRKTKDVDSSGTVLEIAKNGYNSFKGETLFTKDLDGEQISSVVSWENPERTHFGFLVLTTPAQGNLYTVMFLMYHDGKLSVPIDEIATGYPVFPTIHRNEKSGQIQIEFDDGNVANTNDKVRTLVIYTWSDWSKKFMKNVHRVAAESVERRRVEKTQAADGGSDH